MEQFYYCKYCGSKYHNLIGLNSGLCSKHPNGTNMGRHTLFEGREKPVYNCKYCGSSYQRISSLTSGQCEKHPNGPNRGWHEPEI